MYIWKLWCYSEVKNGGDDMQLHEEFYALGEYAAAGLFEQPERSLFYRKALGLRR